MGCPRKPIFDLDPFEPESYNNQETIKAVSEQLAFAKSLRYSEGHQIPILLKCQDLCRKLHGKLEGLKRRNIKMENKNLEIERENCELEKSIKEATSKKTEIGWSIAERKYKNKCLKIRRDMLMEKVVEISEMVQEFTMASEAEEGNQQLTMTGVFERWQEKREKRVSQIEKMSGSVEAFASKAFEDKEKVQAEQAWVVEELNQLLKIQFEDMQLEKNKPPEENQKTIKEKRAFQRRIWDTKPFSDKDNLRSAPGSGILVVQQEASVGVRSILKRKNSVSGPGAEASKPKKVKFCGNVLVKLCEKWIPYLPDDEDNWMDVWTDPSDLNEAEDDDDRLSVEGNVGNDDSLRRRFPNAISPTAVVPWVPLDQQVQSSSYDYAATADFSVNEDGSRRQATEKRKWSVLEEFLPD